MTENQRTMQASPDAVWRVLSDGWLYPLWVVGATRMRDVDADWPAPGSRIHHSAGVWPLIVNDETTVEAVEPQRRMRLRSEEHTSELQSRQYIVCRLLLEKKKRS